MLSRRTFLRTAGVAATSSVAGCAWTERASGYVQLKSIEVTYRKDGQRFSEPVIRVTLGESPEDDAPQVNHLADAWEDRFDTPHEPVVSETLHDDLRRRYEEVTYVLGVCSPSWSSGSQSTGCLNAETTREDFNRVQVYDRVTASADGSRLSIHRVDGRWSFDSD